MFITIGDINVDEGKFAVAENVHRIKLKHIFFLYLLDPPKCFSAEEYFVS